MANELEEKCLQWLLDNSEDIYKSNECLDEVLGEVSEIENQLTRFVEHINEYLSAVKAVHGDTVALTKEATETQDLVDRLEGFIAAVTLTAEAERALRNGDLAAASPENFWCHVKELEQKLKMVSDLLEYPPDVLATRKIDELLQEETLAAAKSAPRRRHEPCESLLDAHGRLADLDSVLQLRVRTFVIEQIQRSFNKNAPILMARQRFMSLTKGYYDWLTVRGATHRCRDILTTYVRTLVNLHMNQVCDYFNLLRAKVPKFEYSESDLRRGLIALGFQPLQGSERSITPSIILPKSNTTPNDTSRSGLMTMLFGSVLPNSQPVSNYIERSTLPTNQEDRVNSLFGTLQDVQSRFDIVSNLQRTAGTLQQYINAGQPIYPEELLRGTIVAFMDIGTQEYQFMSDYFVNDVLVGGGGGSAGGGAAATSSSHGTTPSEGVIASEKSGSICSESNSWGVGNVPTLPPVIQSIRKGFNNVMTPSLSTALTELSQITINSNCDLVGLVVMLSILSKFLVMCRENEHVLFAENLLINLSNTAMRQTSFVVDLITSTVMHNNKPLPGSNSEMFARRGMEKAEYPSTNTVRTLLETFTVCAIGGLEEKSDALRMIIMGVYDDVNAKIVSHEEVFRVYGDICHMCWLLTEVKSDQRASCTHQLELLSDWSLSYKVKLTDNLAQDLISKVRVDLQETVKAAEAQLKTYGNITDPTKIKLAKLTSTDFVSDLRKLASLLEPFVANALGSGEAVMGGEPRLDEYHNELKKDIMTKYAVLYSRYTIALKECQVHTERLISPEELICETRALL